MFLPLSYQSARKLNLQLLFLSFFLSFFLSGCATYKIPTQSFVSVPQETACDHPQVTREQEALKHPLYTIIPRHRSQIKIY